MAIEYEIAKKIVTSRKNNNSPDSHISMKALSPKLVYGHRSNSDDELRHVMFK